jgi:hypothetical protein
MAERSAQQHGELQLVELDNLEQLIGQQIEHRKARIANTVTILLISAVLSAPPLFIFAIWLNPTLVSDVKSFFESWLTVLGPIVGTAVGFYFGTNRNDSRMPSRPRRRRPL